MRQPLTRALLKDSVLPDTITSSYMEFKYKTDINTDLRIDKNTYKVIEQSSTNTEEKTMRRQEAKPKGIRKQTCICQNMFHWSHEMLHIYIYIPTSPERGVEWVGQEKFWVLYLTIKHQKINTLISSMMKQKTCVLSFNLMLPKIWLKKTPLS